MKRLYLILLLFTISKVFAYPISPRPLRMLVQESKYIIVGHVFEVSEVEDEEFSNYSVAKIAVTERIQGRVKEDTIEIKFNPNMMCPAPAMYYKNTNVLAFLDREKKEYYTHALSYGAKTLDAQGMEIYKQRIKEIQDILKLNSQHKQLSETLEWLVKCAENPVTRWEGDYELSPDSDFMSYYSNKCLPDYGILLSANQKMRLKTALFNFDEDYTAFGLVDLVYKGNEAELDDFLIKKFKALPENNFWHAGEYMRRLKHLKPSPEMDKIMASYEELEYGYQKDDEKKKLIQEFLKLIRK